MSWLIEIDKEKQLIKWYLQHEIDSIKLIKIKIKLIRWNDFPIPKTTRGIACSQKKTKTNPIIPNLVGN